MTFDNIAQSNNLSVWEEFEFEDKHNISGGPGVYFLEKKGIICYIGSSSNVKRRVLTHDKICFRKGLRLFVIKVASKEDSLKLEYAILKFFMPKLNRPYGRKKIPKEEKKTRVYILVKGKYKDRAQRELNKIAKKYDNL